MNCPFQVGDRIHELHCLPTFAGSFEEAMAKQPRFELDLSKPHATVMAIHENGFDYRYDERVPIGRPSWGTWTEGGTCYPEGYQFWKIIHEPCIPSPKPAIL